MLDNFSWLDKDLIAGSSLPHEDTHFTFLQEQGIDIIINLTSEPTPDKYAEEFELIHLPIPDYTVPDSETIDRFYKLVEEAEKQNKKVLVHCFAGCGRTGTMLSLWSLRKNKVRNGTEAIRYIRTKRPCSIETEEQEAFVKSLTKDRLSVNNK
ncbi:MAG: dual specificity protein phosphatase family protein [Candidatus Heimdallarchaeota archaeon]|nr:dual specificity protein phosphatase family protein [Candidatus Heimdallarchaeota archaeon]